MITGFFIFSQKGDVLVSRVFREGIKRSISDVFRIQVISNVDVRSPVLTLGSTSFLHIRSGQLWIVAVTRSNVDASLVFESLYKFLNFLKNYLNIPLNKSIQEIDVKLNFTLIYELLDEAFDFGYPQSMDLSSAQNYIASQPIKAPQPTLKNSSVPDLTSDATKQATSDIPWRGRGIKYRKNEVYLDVYEDVNLLMSADGSILRSYVEGHIQMKTHLTGMPECKFGLNDSLMLDSNSNGGAFNEKLNSKSIPKAAAGAVSLENCKFHQCVDLQNYDSERVIKFIPPDGDFELMSYRAVENINLPFKISPTVTSLGKFKVEYQIVIRSLFPNKLFATDVSLRIPVPPGTMKTSIQTSSGKSKFLPEESSIQWKFNKFVGNAEHSFSAEIELSQALQNSANTNGNGSNIALRNSPIADAGSNLLTWSKPPISLSFGLNMFSCSGLVVRFLKVTDTANNKYKTIKWVKYLSKAGSYEIRY
ncbi:hypothetical protein PACTADRAFT_58266 [Pachysolen tannophilus NRRL Y-2460]|uniref:MHD domain-containing protein n=1 Tax=Pachysolen tannophilus NRRL Y-2460 TaxID=669874 RepID=A0A1E4TUN8_PACTA|nr:hypothetical protein PACTADRAFT_58266 [Pachysolen tannophilus NRRL Y-2460]